MTNIRIETGPYPGDEDHLGELGVLVDDPGIGKLDLAVIEGLAQVIKAASGLGHVQRVGLALEGQQQPESRRRRRRKWQEKVLKKCKGKKKRKRNEKKIMKRLRFKEDEE